MDKCLKEVHLLTLKTSQQCGAVGRSGVGFLLLLNSLLSSLPLCSCKTLYLKHHCPLKLLNKISKIQQGAALKCGSRNEQKKKGKVQFGWPCVGS